MGKKSPKSHWERGRISAPEDTKKIPVCIIVIINIFHCMPKIPTKKVRIKTIISGKTNVIFFYLQLLIIPFADDKAKKIWNLPLCASEKEKYISGAADFGAVIQDREKRKAYTND